MNEETFGTYVRGDGEFTITPKREAHLQSIKDNFAEDVDKKYRAGQIEHGGDLWLKPGMLDMALDEIVDLYVYMRTFKQQLDEKNT